MDFALPRAWRVVMAAEPAKRIVSLYYFNEGKLRFVSPA